MIRIVIDTNVALAGFLSYTTDERRLINYAFQKKIVLIGSDETFAEYSRKLDENEHFIKVAKDFMFSKEKLLQMYSAIVRFTPIEESTKDITYCPDDPDDDAFIRTALSASTQIIVSNDKHLLRISGNNGVRVVKPKAFLEILRKNLH